jgi:hypothetical protein
MINLRGQEKASGIQKLDSNEYDDVHTCVATKIDLKGTKCIDGSPAAYYLRRGFGDGVHKFHVHFEGALFSFHITSITITS